MSNRDEVRRIAQAHADFYSSHEDLDFDALAREHWAPDIEIYLGGSSTPVALDDFMRLHSPESGFDWGKTHMDVERVVVGDDEFVLRTVITQWRSHEADAIEASGDTSRQAALEGYQNEPIPSITFYTVKNGKVTRSEGFVFLSPALIASGAARR